MSRWSRVRSPYGASFFFHNSALKQTQTTKSFLYLLFPIESSSRTRFQAVDCQTCDTTTSYTPFSPISNLLAPLLPLRPSQTPQTLFLLPSRSLELPARSSPRHSAPFPPESPLESQRSHPPIPNQSASPRS